MSVLLMSHVVAGSVLSWFDVVVGFLPVDIVSCTGAVVVVSCCSPISPSLMCRAFCGACSCVYPAVAAAGNPPAAVGCIVKLLLCGMWVVSLCPLLQEWTVDRAMQELQEEVEDRKTSIDKLDRLLRGVDRPEEMPLMVILGHILLVHSAHAPQARVCTLKRTRMLPPAILLHTLHP